MNSPKIRAMYLNPFKKPFIGEVTFNLHMHTKIAREAIKNFFINRFFNRDSASIHVNNMMLHIYNAEIGAKKFPGKSYYKRKSIRNR